MAIIRPPDVIRSRRMFSTWEDLRFPAQRMGVGAAAPTWDATEVGWRFANAPPANQEVQMVAQMPHRWRQGSDIIAHLHWYLTVNGAIGENVKWDFLYRVYNVNQARPAGFTTLQITPTVATRTAFVHYLDGWTTITMTGFLLSCLIDIRVQRDTADAADDHEQDVILKEVDIHYQADSFGSVAPTRKWG